MSVTTVAGRKAYQVPGQARGRRSRWWWRPGPGGQPVVCVADLDVWQSHGTQDSGHDSPGWVQAAVQTLADMVVRRVFGAGLILQSAAGPTGEQVTRAVEELDAIIRDVRSAAIEAQTRPWPDGE